MKPLQTPDSILSHEPDYQPAAWQAYEVSELGQWVHLLLKRAGMRSNVEKARKDVEDARNYLSMIEAHVKAAEDAGP